MSTAAFLALIGILCFGAFTQAISGFGFALTAVPLSSMVVSPSRAVVIVALASQVASTRNTVTFRRSIEAPVAKRMIGAAMVGMPLGLVVLEVVSDTALRLTIGVTVALAATLIAAGFELWQGSATTDLATGFISGMLNTSVGTNGPAVVIGLRAHRMEADRFRGTMALVFISSGAVAIALFAIRGRITALDLWVVLAALVPQLLAALIGDRVARLLTGHRFDRMVIGLLYASALAAIVTAIARW